MSQSQQAYASATHLRRATQRQQEVAAGLDKIDAVVEEWSAFTAMTFWQRVRWLLFGRR